MPVESPQQMLDHYKRLIDAMLNEEITRVKLVSTALESLKCGFIFIPIEALNELQEAQKERVKTLENIKEELKYERNRYA